MAAPLAPLRNAVTLRHVAGETGVHPSTVSRALDPAKRHLVAADVAHRIILAAQRLGYRPNPIAASLRTRRSRLVGVLVPDIADPVFAPIVSGVTELLGPEGYSTVIAHVTTDLDRQRILLDELVSRRVDGLVLATVGREDLLLAHCLAEQIPVVLVNRADEAGRACSVLADDMAGLRLAVDHLVALGHRRIGHIAGPQTLSSGHRRRVGFNRAMEARGLALGGSIVSEAAAYSSDEGERAAARLLAINPGLTAIVTANDLLAVGVYRAVRARGLGCPQDMSVTGYDGMPLTDMVAPALTTVSIGLRDIGRAAAQSLIEAIANPGTVPAGTLLAPALIVRASTAAPRPA